MGLLRLQWVRMGIVWTFFAHLSFLSSSLSRRRPIYTEVLSQRVAKLKITKHIVHFSRQCWLTTYHSPVDSEKSELHGVDLQADFRIDMPIRNYRVLLPARCLRRQGCTRLHSLKFVHGWKILSEKTYPSVKRQFLQLHDRNG